MAICDEVPQIKVTVKIDGNEAVEYDDKDGIPDNKKLSNVMNTVSKYIESQDDATFSICVSVDPSYTFESRSHGLSCSVFVDGKWIRTPVIEKHHLSTEVNGHDWLPKGGSTWKMQTLKFASISTVENVAEARIKEDSNAAKSLGLIQVRIQRAVITGEGLRTQSQNKQKAGTAQLTEKALKGTAVSHVATYGTNVDIPTPKVVEVEELDQGTGLILFEFKYRSRDSLQKLMIIPRTPSPDPVEEEIENLSQEAIKSLARRQLLQDRASSRKIKAENWVVIKKEPEVYDLTGDSPDYDKERKWIETIDLTED